VRLWFIMWCICPLAYAEELMICYNYGCSSTAKVVLSSQETQRLTALFHDGDDALAERASIGKAVALLQSFASEQTPTRFDRPGNFADDVADGRMDCIDHSRNSTTYLEILQSRGLLKHHRVLSPIMRAPWLVNVHWAARIADEGGREFAVDSWGLEQGVPVPLVPLAAWLRGADG
jgi:hypothetical protein